LAHATHTQPEIHHKPKDIYKLVFSRACSLRYSHSPHDYNGGPPISLIGLNIEMSHQLVA